MTATDEGGDGGGPGKQALVVLGMHRSGTSALTRVLSLAGAALPLNLMPPGAGNEQGHWEPLDVTALNDEIFGRIDSGWDDVFGPRDLVRRRPPPQRYLPQARAILRDNYDGEDLIVLKDPRIGLFPDLWDRALTEEGYRPSYVVAVRDPREVAASLKGRNGFVVNKSLILWATHMLSADLFTRDKPRVIISYDELFDDTEALLDKVELTLRLRLPRRSWASMVEIQDFVTAAHRHHRIDGGNGALAAFPEIARFHAYLRATARGEAWNEDVSADLARWLGRLESATAPIIKSLEATLAANGARAADQLARSEQTIAALQAGLDAARRETAAAEAGARDLQRQLAASREAEATLQARLDEIGRAFAERDAELAAATEAGARREAILHGQLTQARDQALDGERRLSEAESSAARLRLETDAAETALREAHARLDNTITQRLRRTLRRGRWWARS